MSLFLCNVYRHTLYTHKSVLPSRIRARTLFRAATKTVDHRSVSDCGDICITANEVVPLRQSDAQWAAPAQYGCAAHCRRLSPERQLPVDLDCLSIRAPPVRRQSIPMRARVFAGDNFAEHEMRSPIYDIKGKVNAALGEVDASHISELASDSTSRTTFFYVNQTLWTFALDY